MSIAEQVAPTGSSQRRRDQILENALAVFSRKGFTDSRIDDISVAAGISRATFYRYFDGKDGVFDALVDLMSKEVIGAAEHVGAVTPDAAGLATLRRWIVELIAITERWGTLVDEVIRPRDKNAEARLEAVAMTAIFADILGARLTDGGVTGLDPAMAAISMIAMTERTAHQVRTWNIEIDRETVADALATIALKMLHPTAPVLTRTDRIG
jgi:AcrR family transcriptional regulator